jgi:hypothetical protein
LTKFDKKGKLLYIGEFMNKNNWLYGLFSILIIFSTISCFGRFPSMVFYADDKILAKRFKQILEAIKNEDADSLKMMFSKKVLEESKQIDNDINYLFSIFQGEVVSWEQKGVSSSQNRNYGEITKETRCFFNVDTTSQKYIVYIIEYTEDTVNPENVGLYTLRIIKAEDKETQSGYWQDMEIPGIYNPHN